MKKKKFLQACDIGGSIYGKKRSSGKKVSPIHKSVTSKELMEVYSKFYKDQVSALYRAVRKKK
ncbi:MAG: hypothetical protein U9R44_05420 [Candidatus Omnitrophota bacterium]|nr:hypothetical protein [Candidatus Omnitrophota bacterium]